MIFRPYHEFDGDWFWWGKGHTSRNDFISCGFGSFSLHFRPPRLGRNPKTGDSVALPGKYVPHFKPGKELRDRVNGGADPSDD